jgi:hypothetical protein
VADIGCLKTCRRKTDKSPFIFQRKLIYFLCDLFYVFVTMHFIGRAVILRIQPKTNNKTRCALDENETEHSYSYKNNLNTRNSIETKL